MQTMLTQKKIDILNEIYTTLFLHFQYHFQNPSLLRNTDNLEFKNGFFRGLARLEENYAEDSIFFMQKLSKKAMDYNGICLNCNLDYVLKKEIHPTKIEEYFIFSKKIITQTIDKIQSVKKEFEDCTIIYNNIEQIIMYLVYQKRLLCKMDNILKLDGYSTSSLNYCLDKKVHEKLYLIKREIKDIKYCMYKNLV